MNSHANIETHRGWLDTGNETFLNAVTGGAGSSPSSWSGPRSPDYR
jgi:hypothetical protein